MTSERLGATPHRDGSCTFRVWSPLAERVRIALRAPDREVEMAHDNGGDWIVTVDDVRPGARYFVRIGDGEPRPDPASRSQPEGVHGASEVVDLAFDWTDHGWRGLRMDELVLYELHVGTFTNEGTFDAVIPRLPALRELGITAIELMPVAQFPGSRNWGYDGVQPFATQDSYGGVRGLQRLVDACHREGLGVVMDVVYNHLGPEGNYLAEFGPYFNHGYVTPWGPAINFDGEHSDGVRRYFVENALQWTELLHCDGLRLDATHAIHDRSAKTFLEELTETVHERTARAGRRALVIAESDQNAPSYVRSPDRGGLGMDGIWCDDLHHALHSTLTGERGGYYEDFDSLELLASAWRSGMAFTGQWSRFRHRRHGREPGDVSPSRFVVCSQNHDQVGNRARGDRLSTLVDPRALRLAAAVVLTSPCTPLLFMGEEYGEHRPFLYFTSHGDPELAEAVRRGRREEFAAFAWQGEVPDPQDDRTFESSILGEPDEGGREIRAAYRELLRIRRELPRGAAHAECLGDEVMIARRSGGDGEVHCVFHFGRAPREVPLPLPEGEWRRLWDSAPATTAVPERLRIPGDGVIRLDAWQAVLLAPARR